MDVTPDSDFRTLAHGHLARYKREVLGVSADGISGKKKKAYPHVLPDDQFRLNIAPGIRDEFWALAEKAGWKRHHLFHHLSSSQALAFNLFFPLLAKWPATVGPYLRAFGLQGRPIRRTAIEEIIDPQEQTRVDAVIEFIDGSRCIVEVKYIEAAFGSAPADDEHRKKLAEIYRPKLAAHLHPDCLAENRFLKDYQLFRNLYLLRPGTADHFLMVMPRAHAALWNHAGEWARDEQLQAFTGQVTVVALEDVLASLASGTGETNPRLAKHAAELATKYLPQPGTAS